ncbi:GNAT family N-acetyltransferase [Celerinatantimonas diazotrophica]|uniref:Putative acetyltransferase n=1 Tax=Celerinatantimonas diazotrophica TaxID=412034 RepID=A0A4R1KF86_9GAMM|nr:N-acetyltransferase [Celerinatantimonas diazotrophica]TCK63346.1 putative acetyltransferase [Celerinatantimonas diazotrophica]CAG9298490.1 hypothetical protein CEDIAZO_03695 [Celerinatantimonas diazotrophica]
MSSLSPTFRIARPSDYDAIRQIYIQVFQRPQEAKFVEAIRAVQTEFLSLIAEVDGHVSGHLFASPISLAGEEQLRMMILEPMAVIPKYQGDGIGSAMVKVGIEQLRLRNYDALVVMGLPDYYPRFGFEPMANLGWQYPFSLGCTVAQVANLHDEPLPVVQAMLQFSSPFNQLYQADYCIRR